MLDNKVDQQAMRSPLHFMKGQRSKFLNDGDVGLTITEISDSCYLNLRGKFDDANFVGGIDGAAFRKKRANLKCSYQKSYPRS